MIQCSAPGKLFLSGEYAVLSGSPAVVTAVDRRATATVTERPEIPSPLMQSILHHTAAYLKERGFLLPEGFTVEVSSNDFRIGKHKLGLGSSAAVAAAGVGVLFESAGCAIDDHRTEILGVAIDAHRAAQNGKGSGADVAAAVMGGTNIYTPLKGGLPVNIEGLHIEVIWSGQPVSTAAMIGEIDRFRAADPAAHRARMANLEQLANGLADAFKARNIDRIIEGARGYAAGMEALGSSAGVPIVTKPHKRLINLAEDLGGAAKPSGAGGGDIAVAFFKEKGAADRFRVQCIRHEMPVLEITADAPGLRRDVDKIDRLPS
jgi:phosphomevalonate kinase